MPLKAGAGEGRYHSGRPRGFALQQHDPEVRMLLQPSYTTNSAIKRCWMLP